MECHAMANGFQKFVLKIGEVTNCTILKISHFHYFLLRYWKLLKWIILWITFLKKINYLLPEKAIEIFDKELQLWSFIRIIFFRMPKRLKNWTKLESLRRHSNDSRLELLHRLILHDNNLIKQIFIIQVIITTNYFSLIREHERRKKTQPN